jgi:hypothetical protein
MRADFKAQFERFEIFEAPLLAIGREGLFSQRLRERSRFLFSNSTLLELYLDPNRNNMFVKKTGENSTLLAVGRDGLISQRGKNVNSKQIREIIISRLGNRCHICGRELPADQLRLHHVKEGVGYNSRQRWQD